MAVSILAAHCGVSAREIRDLEAGRVTDPDLTLGIRIAQVFCVDPVYLALGHDGARLLCESLQNPQHSREARTTQTSRRCLPSAHLRGE